MKDWHRDRKTLLSAEDNLGNLFLLGKPFNHLKKGLMKKPISIILPMLFVSIAATAKSTKPSNDVSVVSGKGVFNTALPNGVVADIVTELLLGYGDNGPEAKFELKLKDADNMVLTVTGAKSIEATCSAVEISDSNTKLLLTEELRDSDAPTKTKKVTIRASCQDKNEKEVSFYLDSSNGDFTAILREESTNSIIIGDSLSVK